MERGDGEGGGTRAAPVSTPGHAEARARGCLAGLWVSPYLGTFPVILIGTLRSQLMSAYFPLCFKKLHVLLLTSSHAPLGLLGPGDLPLA